MLILVFFAFLAGIVTVLSPCILPVLPIILSSSVDNTGYRRPFGVVTGFVASFTFFTLFLSAIVNRLGIPADSLRNFSIVILVIFGLSLLVPKFQKWLELQFAKLSIFAPSTAGKSGYWGGFVIGLSLGLLWTPCVGPILASVISLALTGQVSGQALVITFTYALGTAVPMFLVMLGGNTAVRRVPWLASHSAQIQRAFGVIMVATAVVILFNFDRRFQSYILDRFPSYGVGLTQFEDNEAVTKELDSLNSSPMPAVEMGSPMFEISLPKGPPAPELIPGGEWFNTDPLTLAEQKGKVVLIDFWTYTCINCIRTLPYLKTWHDKYSEQGLVVIGVHAPEFEFEKDSENVREAIADFGLEYPVMQDNNFATWRAYNNRYWPAKYLIDKDGFVRYRHFGEGDYDETESAIQNLLAETGATVAQPVQNPGYTNYARTPETYLGQARSVYNPDLDLVGNWELSDESATPPPGSSLSYQFEAKSVYLVMRSVSGEPATVRVFLDEVEQSPITVTKDMLYTILDLPSPGSYNLRLEFPEGNLELYAFTFG